MYGLHRIVKPNPNRIKVNPDKLNRHFITTATRMTGATSKANLQKFIQNLPYHQNTSKFELINTTYEEVRKEINSLRNDCSSGYDHISVTFIKAVVDDVSSPLTNIINNCIVKSLYPSKINRVCPIPKTNNPTSLDDYRPISVLPILSKVFERVILRQLCNHIEQNHIYNTTQSGFRRGHSCETILLKLRDDIYQAMDNGEVTVAVAADYSKAFDIVNYQKLIQQLHQLNFSKQFLFLITSYLSNREQFVQIDDKPSKKGTVQFGVPQGSILGPVLFNIYMSNLSAKISNLMIPHRINTLEYQIFKIHQKV